MGVKALVYFEIVTTAALFIGLAVVNFIKPGVGVTLAAGNTDVIKTIGQSHPKTLIETIVHAFPVQRDRRDGARRRSANRRVQRALRPGGVGGRRKRKTDRSRDGKSVAGDVQVHQLRDDVRAHRRRRGHGAHRRHARSGCAAQSRQIDPLALSRAHHFHRPGFRARHLHRARADATICARGARAGRARVCHHEQRIGLAQSDAGDGTIRRAAAHRRVRDADGIFIQSRRLDTLSGDGVGVRRASGRDDDGLAHGSSVSRSQ